MNRKPLNLSKTLINFDSKFKETLLQILPNPDCTLNGSDNDIFNKDIEDFIKKYGGDNYSSIDELLDSSSPKSYFNEEESGNFSDTLESLLPK